MPTEKKEPYVLGNMVYPGFDLDRLCHKLNVRVLAQLLYWNLNLSVMLLVNGAFERWVGREDRALVEEAACPLCPVRTQGKLAICEAGSKFSPDTHTGKVSHLWSRKQVLTRHPICHHLNLEAPSLQKQEKLISVVFMSPNQWHFVIAAWAG